MAIIAGWLHLVPSKCFVRRNITITEMSIPIIEHIIPYNKREADIQERLASMPKNKAIDDSVLTRCLMFFNSLKFLTLQQVFHSLFRLRLCFASKYLSSHLLNLPKKVFALLYNYP